MNLTLKEFIDRRKARKAKRLDTRRFNAKMDGELIQPSKGVVRAQLDTLSSMIVRRRDRRISAGYCLVCIAREKLGFLQWPLQPIILAYHIEPRGDDATRWNLDNLVGACMRCNGAELFSRQQGFKSRGVARARIRAIHSAIIGEQKLLELEALSRTTTHRSLADLIELRDERKKMLAGPQEAA